MIQRIDLLMPPRHRTGYGVLPYFTRCFAEALADQQIECRILGNEQGDNPHLVSDLLKDAPDLTLSFNGLLPDRDGKFLCEMIRIPHIACLLDSPNLYMELAKSPLNVITCDDRSFVQFFRELKAPHVFFMPHAVEARFLGEIDADRPYEVSVTGTCMDFEGRRQSWPERFSPAMAAVLEEAAEITLSDQTTSYLQAYTQAMDHRLRTKGDIDPASFDHEDLFDQLEFYIRGKDRFDVITAIKDAPVHIFGTKSGQRGWDDYLKGMPNAIIHGRIPYEETLAVMQKSKIILNSTPTIKDGAHERIFAGIMAGAAVITNETRFLTETFENGRTIAFYKHGRYDRINEQVMDLLRDETARRELVKNGREIVRQNHTWEVRAKSLVDYLNFIWPQLESLL